MTLMAEKPKRRRRNPARYTKALLPVFARMLQGSRRILDPFGGEGGIFALQPDLPDAQIEAIEIEPEWCQCHPRTTLGNALALPWPDAYFTAICTSPCLTPENRILTKDLRWVPCGDLVVGDEIITFDEFSPGVKPTGQPLRRRWRLGTITQSYPAKKECVRVWLENGESIVCTADHPWLSNQYGDNSRGNKWVAARDLMASPYVLKQLEPWKPETSYDAGWLAGILDGEGSLSFGVHGAPKLQITQVDGPVADSAQEKLRKLGIDFSVLARTGVPANHQPISNIYINGGFPGLLSALGRLRPVRLMGKLDALDAASRSIQPWKIKVMAVEPVGLVDIQGIETSTGTYIGEGYLHHNTYGNRMADRHKARDASVRNTYTHVLGRELHPDNSGQLQWGPKYRAFHVRAWIEASRVLAPGGIFIINMKDHIRAGKVQPVTAWHRATLESLGYYHIETAQVVTPGQRNGANGHLRIPYDSIMLFIKRAL